MVNKWLMQDIYQVVKKILNVKTLTLTSMIWKIAYGHICIILNSENSKMKTMKILSSVQMIIPYAVVEMQV